MHEVAHAAARLYPSLTMHDLAGVERTVAAFEARLAAVTDATSPEEIQALASKADRYAATNGAQNGPWNRHVQSVCAAHARACCCASGQECYVNGPDSNTRYFASGGAGKRATERANVPRSRWGGR